MIDVRCIQSCGTQRNQTQPFIRAMGKQGNLASLVNTKNSKTKWLLCHFKKRNKDVGESVRVP